MSSDDAVVKEMDVAAVNAFKKTFEKWFGLDPGPNLHVMEQRKLNESEMEEDLSHLYGGLCSLCLSTELMHLKMEPFWGWVCIYRINSLCDQRVQRTTRPSAPRAAQLQEPSGDLPREPLSWGKVMRASRQAHLLSGSVCSLIIDGNALV